MEIYTLEKDIPVFYITADSFPNGVEAAHDKLRAKLSHGDNRAVFGISFPNKEGKIIYKAAAEELQNGEAEKLALEKFIIKKGNYTGQLLPNFSDNLKRVGEIFQELLSAPNIEEEEGYCLEMYLNEKDMRCMVPLKA